MEKKKYIPAEFEEIKYAAEDVLTESDPFKREDDESDIH